MSQDLEQENNSQIIRVGSAKNLVDVCASCAFGVAGGASPHWAMLNKSALDDILPKKSHSSSKCKTELPANVEMIICLNYHLHERMYSPVLK